MASSFLTHIDALSQLMAAHGYDSYTPRFPPSDPASCFEIQPQHDMAPLLHRLMPGDWDAEARRVLALLLTWNVLQPSTQLAIGSTAAGHRACLAVLVCNPSALSESDAGVPQTCRRFVEADARDTAMRQMHARIETLNQRMREEVAALWALGCQAIEQRMALGDQRLAMGSLYLNEVTIDWQLSAQSVRCADGFWLAWDAIADCAHGGRGALTFDLVLERRSSARGNETFAEQLVVWDEHPASLRAARHKAVRSALERAGLRRRRTSPRVKPPVLPELADAPVRTLMDIRFHRPDVLHFGRLRYRAVRVVSDPAGDGLSVVVYGRGTRRVLRPAPNDLQASLHCARRVAVRLAQRWVCQREDGMTQAVVGAQQHLSNDTARYYAKRTRLSVGRAAAKALRAEIGRPCESARLFG